MTADAWLNVLAPGTMLFRKDKDWGFYLVYHAEVQEFPGSWKQLNVWMLESQRCKLVKVEVESSVFFERWAIAVHAD